MTTNPTSLGDELPKELQRVRAVRDTYVELRGTPGVNVEIAIALMDQAINAADKAVIEWDVIAMLRAYNDLKGFEA